MSDKDKREIAAFLALAGVTAAAMLFFRPAPPAPVTRTPVPIADDQALHPGAGLFDVSRDGSFMVYRRQGDRGSSELWARRWDGLDAGPIRDTGDAHLPAISPDGREVAFTAGGDPARIRVVPLTGGSARTIVDSAAVGGVRWSPDGAWIYYTNAALGLSRVPARGGPAEILTRADTLAGGEIHWGVEVLPGGRALVYTSSAFEVDDPRIEVLNLETGEVTDVWTGSFPRYSESGYLLFMDAADASLSAAPFDSGRLEMGSPETVVAEILHPDGWPLFSMSQTGTLWYAATLEGAMVSPVWVDRDGNARALNPDWTHRGHATYSSLALSPDDERLAISIPSQRGSWDLWLKPLEPVGAPPSRLTFEGGFNYRPTWSPDGAALTFISDRAGQADLWRMHADGTGAELVLDRPGVIRNGFLSPDGAWVVFREGEAPVADIFAIRSGPDPVEVPLVVTETGERSPSVSPNGRWLAYTSLDSGRWNVWVTDFLQGDSTKWLISPEGGEEPVWAHSGRELFYRSSVNELVAVEIGEDATLGSGARQALFSMDPYLRSDGRPQYVVSADDTRFLMLRLEEGGAPGLVRVDNLFESLRLSRE